MFGEEQINLHIQQYVGLGFASQMVDWVFSSSTNTKKLLDIGSGFGSFVFLCRAKGVDAFGIELMDYEVGYARRRLMTEKPDDDPEFVYRKGNALQIPFPKEHFDTVTLWNVLEHIQDYGRLLHEVHRVMKSGGDVYIVCPNYLAFRKEAHYQVPWIPMMPRALAIFYLRLFKKDPSYFRESIFYRTNWGVLFTLRENGFRLKTDNEESYLQKILNPQMISNMRKRSVMMFLRRIGLSGIIVLFFRIRFLPRYFKLYNPIKNSIVLHVMKSN